MRLAILSDVHGNLHGLEACLADLAEQGGADAVVGAGDYCADGPRPREVLERLRSVNAVCVRGNTDRSICESAAAPSAPAGGERGGASGSAAADDDAEYAWQRARLGPAWLAWLGALPFALRFGEGDAALLVVHANPKSDDEHLRPDADDATLERFTEGVPERTIAFGHLHVPYVRTWRGRTFVDVSSAGLPKDGDPRAAYAILTLRSGGWHVRERRVAFDVEAVAREIERGDMPHKKKRLVVLRRHAYKDLAGLTR